MGALKRWSGIGLFLPLMCLAPTPSTAYVTKLANGNLVRWQAGSPAGIWTDATKTLNWSFNPISFPRTNWPSAEQAGAAFQNAYQSFQDVVGSSFKQNRLPNSSGTPATDDGKVEMVLAPNEGSDYFGTDITGAFAVTYWSWNATSGAMSDGDIVFNGDPASFTWSTQGPPAPANSNDIEVTQIHEAIHGVGGGHPVYLFAAVWPTGRFPEDLMRDRCLSPDDRVLLRTLYGEAPALGTINGQVNLSSGGGADRAIVVASDLDGIPQATVVTALGGSYSINVPAGTYSVTVHHNSNVGYAPSDISFAGASDFINSTTVSGVAVTAGGTVTAGAITATAPGSPTLFFSGLSLSPNPLGSQTLFLPKNSTGTAQFELFGTTFGAAPTVNLGPGITIDAVSTAGDVINVQYTVTAGAVAGLRTVEVVAAGERALLPSGVFVLDTGSLTLAAGAANPTAASAAPSTVDGPLLQVNLAAGAVEDVRIRRLQFDLTGTGPALSNIRLWNDLDANGTVSAGDVRIFSGAAYAASPIAETKSLAPPASVIFDNLSFSILAGTSANLLLTADYPAAGTGTFTAALASAGITAHGMFYGDVIATTGATVSGGTQTMANLAVGSLAQIRTTGGATIPVGGYTPETQVTIQGVPTSSVGTVGIEVEVKPLGTAFTGTGTVSSANTFASGATVSVNVTGLADQTSYHWQIRALSSTFPPSAWISFGGNAESAIDFSVDTSTTSPPSGLGQFESGGTPAVPLGGTVRGGLLLSATNGTNSAGSTVRLEIEVRPSGTAFSNLPNLLSGFGPGGGLAAVSFSGGTNDYHWQARTVGLFGSASAWVLFDPAAIHFHLEAINVIEASAGCVGSVAATPETPWVAGAIALAVLGLLRRRVSKAGMTGLLLLVSAVAAQADVPTRLEVSEPTSSLKPSSPWGSVQAYTGLLFFDAEFDAMGTDFQRRKVDDTGTWVLGLEAMINLHPDWAIGGTAELGLSSDIQIVGIGPLLSWRFAASRTDTITRRADFEHRIRVGGLYQTLEVDKSGFGDFDPTFALRAGYEVRIAFADHWGVVLGVELRHAIWDYADDVLTGDEELGGTAALISLGIAFLP